MDKSRLKAARIALIGAGEIGSPATKYIAAARVGTLVVIDDDRVTLSNVQRQTLFGTRGVGTSKVVAAQTVTPLNLHIADEIRP